jgi:AcrR family transcriptional regulator
MDETQKIRDKIIDTMLALAGRQPWDEVGFLDIAQESGVSLAALYIHFEDKTAILAAFARRLDAQITARVGALREDETCRDRLFDILMERYELLNAHRAAVRSFLSALRFDPKQVIIGMPHLGRSIQAMLDLAGIDSQGLRGAVKLTGVIGVYLHGLSVLMRDDSPDMSRLMAALDQDLQRSERVMNFLSF